MFGLWKSYHNCNRKNHFEKYCSHNRKALQKIEKTKTESSSADFFLDTINLQKTLKIWLTFLKSKINPPIGIFLYLIMVLQYPIR